MAQLARILLWIESAVWAVLGVLLIAGGFIVLGGGTGVPGVINVGEPGFGPGIGAWAVGVGVVGVVIGGAGMWIGLALHRRARIARAAALSFCGVWIVLGVVWIAVATTPIPGLVTLVVNGVIVLGFVLPPRPLTTTGRGR
jgi:hypothetical protein